MVRCGYCGKEHDGYESYYMARRSESVMKVGNVPGGTWDYFGVAPVFFACSRAHYEILLRLLLAEKAASERGLFEKIEHEPDEE